MNLKQKNKLKADWEESEMEQSKCLLQGPRTPFPGPLDMVTACYLPLTGQAPHGQPWTGQQASCSQGHMLPRCVTPWINVKRGRVCEESLQYTPPGKHLRQCDMELYRKGGLHTTAPLGW